MSDIKSINAQKRILDEALLLLQGGHLSPDLLKKASKNAGFPPLFYHTVFMNGVIDFAHYIHEALDYAMIEATKTIPLSTLPVRERIFCIIQARLIIASKNKEAYRKLHYFKIQPTQLLTTAQWNWKTMDIIWRLAGDSSTDFNYYTKRSLLLAVYSSTCLYWLNDASDNHHASWGFLRRRIANVLALGSYKQQLKQFFS